jgi:heme-binding protein
VVGVCLFAVAQVVRPAKTNPPVDPSMTLESRVAVDPQAAAILDRACADCHSNKTRWPWYSNVAPVSWFVIDHVNDGRGHLNYSEWGKYSAFEQQGLLRQTCLMVKKGAMPLSSYTPMHPGSKLTAEDTAVICTWVNKVRGKL